MSRRRLMDNKSGVDENTLLLLHGEDFTDSSSRNHSLLIGNATIDNNGKFGKSIKCSGSGYQIRIDKADFQLGGSDFTLDFWLKLSTSSSNALIVNMGTVNTWAYGYQITLEDNGKEGMMLVYAPNIEAVHIPISYNDMKSSYNHYAFQRQGAKMSAFLNGVLINELSINYSIPNATCPYFYIGSHTTGTEGCQFFIDDFRFSNVARWTTNFNPPTKPY